MNIAGRLSLGTALLVGVASAASIAGLRTAGQGIKATRALVSEVVAEQVAVDAAALGLLEARRAEKDFLLRLDLKYVKQLDDRVRSTITALERVAAVSTDEARLATTAALITQTKTYGEVFHRLVKQATIAGLDRASGMKGTLRKAVHAVEATVRAANLPALTVLVLMARRHEKDYLLRGDLKYQAQVAARVAEFSKAVGATELSAKTKRGLLKSMDEYQRDFDAMVAATGEVARRKLTLREAAHGVEAGLVALREGASRAVQAASEATVTNMRADRSTLLVVLLLSVLLGAGVAFWLIRSITGPLRRLSTRVSDIAAGQGDLTQRVELARDDELGQLGDHLDQFIGTVQSVIQDVNIATGQLRERSAGLRAEAAPMQENAERSADTLGTIASEAQQIADHTMAVASAIEELNASINEIARSAARVSQVAGGAVVVADRAGQVIDELGRRSEAIGEVVSLISNVASQTNLLALNATIEAARAGDAGKGFAVVANEVKALAQQTGEATGRITQMVAEIQDQGREAIVAVQKIANVIAEVDEIQTSVGAAVEEQSTTVREIVAVVDETSSGSTRIAGRLKEVAHLARATSETAASTLALSDGVEAVSERLEGLVDHFVV